MKVIVVQRSCCLKRFSVISGYDWCCRSFAIRNSRELGIDDVLLHRSHNVVPFVRVDYWDYLKVGQPIPGVQEWTEKTSIDEIDFGLDSLDGFSTVDVDGGGDPDDYHVKSLADLVDRPINDGAITLPEDALLLCIPTVDPGCGMMVRSSGRLSDLRERPDGFSWNPDVSQAELDEYSAVPVVGTAYCRAHEFMTVDIEAGKAEWHEC